MKTYGLIFISVLFLLFAVTSTPMAFQNFTENGSYPKWNRALTSESAPLLLACCDINTGFEYDYSKTIGISIINPPDRNASIVKGQMIQGKVDNPALLSKAGINGASVGDQIILTYEGEGKFSVLHKATGKTTLIKFPQTQQRY